MQKINCLSEFKKATWSKAIFLSLFALLSFTSFSQQKTIKGNLSDDAGKPLSGISIVVKGTGKGTSTNANGEFSIEAKEGDVLEFSAIGYKKNSVTIGNDNNISVTMTQDVTAEQEVIVVGYSTKKASQLSSAVSVVSGDKLRDVTSNDVSSLLQGKAPGVVVTSNSGDPTSGASILIRGAGSISAGTGPLFVVDGNIGGTYNPNDVESITILKDAAATGLYGSRAGNGVIIITTKSGKSGKAKIDLASTVGFNKASFGDFKMMNSQQLYDYEKTFTNPDASVLNTNTNWIDEAFRQSLTQSHTLSASGGTDKTQYYVSGNFYKEEGTLKANDKTAYNFRTNLTQKLSNKLKLGVLLNGIFTKDNYNPSGALYQAYTYMPWDNPYNADGTPADPRLVNWYGRDGSNFLFDLQYNLSRAKSLNVTGDLNLDYNITKNLSFASYNRVNYFEYNSMSFYDPRSQGGATNSGELYNTYSHSNEVLTSNRLRYNQSFVGHNLTLLAVGEATQTYYDVLNTAVKNLPAGRPFASNATDIISNPSGGRDESSFQKYLGQADYNFANTYFLVASLVRERSSKFGGNNPWGTFYQLGGSWILSNEGFIKRIKPISFLKLRASYGTTGNAEFGAYSSLGLYTISSGASYNGLPGAYPTQKPNPDLTWEKQQTANLGLEVSFFKRIDLTVDVYQKTAKSLLFFVPLPSTTGYSGQWNNAGDVRNKGVEFNLTTKNVNGKSFTWETNLNMAFNKNKVQELVSEGALFGNPGGTQPIGLGHDMNEWYMRVWAGVDPVNGDPLWEKIIVDADGKEFLTYTNNYSAATVQYTGRSSAPKFTGGITNNFTYKGFTLSAFAYFVNGNAVYNSSRFAFDNDGGYDTYNAMVLADGWSRWQKPGDIATHPKPVLGGAGNGGSKETSTRFLEDGSYIRLRNVTLGYDLPNTLLGRLNIKNARLFVSGDNLWTSTGFSGPDPAAFTSSSYVYPPSKKILFGLNVSF